MSYIDILPLNKVCDAQSFAEFARQNLGVPFLRKDIAVMNLKAQEFFELNPNANWKTLARTAQWCKSKKFRPRHLSAIIGCARHAWADGYLPELDITGDEKLEADIVDALQVETDPYWRQVLIASQGPARLAVYRDWLDQRKVSA